MIYQYSILIKTYQTTNCCRLNFISSVRDTLTPRSLTAAYSNINPMLAPNASSTVYIHIRLALVL